jgi:hypothetical protein
MVCCIASRMVPAPLLPLADRMRSSLGAIGHRAGALRHLLAIVDCLTAEGALIDLTLTGPRERDAQGMQGYAHVDCAAEISNRIVGIRASERRTSFAPETTSSERNERDRNRTKTQ